MQRSPVLLWLFFCAFILLCSAQQASAQTPEDDILIPLHVAAGTNLIHIARDYCHQRSDWKIIARINKLTPPYIIYRETNLQVPRSLLVLKELGAHVASVHGKVFVQSKNGTRKPLRKGQTILPGQTIETEADSYSHLLLPNSTYTRIEANSRCTLSTLLRLRDGSLKAELFLTQGNLIHRLRNKLKANETFRTRTPIAITGVRGTEFRVKTGDGHSNKVETLHGVVRLSASGQTVTLQAGQGSRVREQAPPEPARLLPPQPPQSNLPALFYVLPVRLPAPHIARATTVQLRLTADAAGQETLLKQVVSPGQEFILGDLDDGRYFLFLTAFDADGFESLPLGPLPFQLRTSPAAPVITAPESKTHLWGSHCTINWLASEQADHYLVDLAIDPTFSTIITHQKIQTNTYTTAELEPGTYYFRVQTVTADGFHTLYSRPLSWTLAPTPNLGSLETTADKVPVLQWPTMAPDWQYDLQIARDKAFHYLVLEKHALPQTSYTLEETLGAGTYYVRLRGTARGKPVSRWTPPQTLTIHHKPLGWEEALMGVICLGLIIL